MSSLALYGGKPVRTAQYAFEHHWGAEACKAINEVLDNRATSTFYGGPFARKFEQRFASIHKRGFGISCNSGTAALHVAYQAMGLEAGDEVIIPANAYVSAFSAALQLNAIPRLCDITEDNCMDVDHAASLVGPHTKLVVPVHLYGFPVDVPRLRALVCQHGLHVIEDCGQGHGALMRDELAGTFGDVACFSFFTCKHITTGEGGMCLTDSDEVSQQIRALCHKGKGLGWYDYRSIGYSYTMTDIQAALGLTSLDGFENEVERRRKYAKAYATPLGEKGFELVKEPKGSQSSFFKYPFRLPPNFRVLTEWFERACRAENVVVSRGYPHLASLPWICRKEYSAWHLTDTGKSAKYIQEDTPCAMDLTSRTLTACTGPGISDVHVEQTIDAITKIFDYMEKNRSRIISEEHL